MKNKNYLISLLFTVYFTSATASPLIVAHRAGTADYPENTVHAISMAIRIRRMLFGFPSNSLATVFRCCTARVILKALLIVRALFQNTLYWK